MQRARVRWRRGGLPTTCQSFAEANQATREKVQSVFIVPLKNRARPTQELAAGAAGQPENPATRVGEFMENQGWPDTR